MHTGNNTFWRFFTNPVHYQRNFDAKRSLRQLRFKLVTI